MDACFEDTLPQHYKLADLKTLASSLTKENQLPDAVALDKEGWAVPMADAHQGAPCWRDVLEVECNTPLPNGAA